MALFIKRAKEIIYMCAQLINLQSQCSIQDDVLIIVALKISCLATAIHNVMLIVEVTGIR